GGMSFHGGLVGALVAGFYYCRKHGLPFLALADRFFIVAPIGLGLGRIGNFINGELWGRPAPAWLPWAMVYPHVDPIPRHPSQIYEMLLEGVALFGIMWGTRKRPWPEGARIGVFLVGYAVMRIIAEQFREPDPQLGFLFDHITMGMLLSSVMLLAGGAWLWIVWRRR
ncbi:MAG: prolipoprotein diacylglyceryl transferase, partial [Zetaproteobacteria bacterium]